MIDTYSLCLDGFAKTDDGALIVRLSTGEAPTVRIGTYFKTKADRDAILALFPKSTNVRPGGISTSNPINCADGWTVVPALRFQVNFERNGVTGEFNETGLRRWNSFKRSAAKAGLEVRADTLHSATMEEFEAAIGV